MKLLELSGTEITSYELNAISLCINNLEELKIGNWIRGSGISVEGINNLAEAIKRKSHPVI